MVRGGGGEWQADCLRAQVWTLGQESGRVADLRRLLLQAEADEEEAVRARAAETAPQLPCDDALSLSYFTFPLPPLCSQRGTRRVRLVRGEGRGVST